MNRGKPDRRDVLFFLIVTAACNVFIAGGIITAQWASRHLLHQDAEATAAVWAEYVAQQIDIDRVLAGDSVPGESQMYFEQARQAGRVFLYEIFDPRGLVVLRSDPLDRVSISTAHQRSQMFMPKILAGIPQVQVKTGEEPLRPAYFAEAYFPVIDDNVLKAIVGLYIDQTEKAALFGRIFGVVSVILAVLMAIAVSLPLYIVWQKLRQRREAENRTRFLAHHDALTGLSNRFEFNQRLENALTLAKRNGTDVGLFYVDVDCFKDVNDALGHDAGDVLLCHIAQRLSADVRDVDMVARLGGDEFVVIQFGMETRTDAAKLAARMCRNLADVYQINGHDIASSVSIGVAIGPKNGDEANQLLRSADLALYRAKKGGRSSYCFFEPWMAARLHARRQFEQEMRHALSNQQFELHYQPQFDLLTGGLLGFEALLRWHRMDCAVVPPSEFIPVAEETGLIVPLGAWALRHACLEATTWAWSGRIAVNLSPAQFWSSDVVSLVKEATYGLGLSPERLELEITESLLLRNTEDILETIHKIKDLGVSITLDDFGIGYSSLSYLWKFPFDKIKIDQSFIQSLHAGKHVAAIIDAVFSLGRSLNITIAAEGVETIEQASFLKEQGCQQVQGFLFGRPLPIGEVRNIINRAAKGPEIVLNERAALMPRQKFPAAMLGTESPQNV